MVKNTKKTMQDTENCVLRPASFVYVRFISHYSLIAGVVMFTTVVFFFFT